MGLDGMDRFLQLNSPQGLSILTKLKAIAGRQKVLAGARGCPDRRLWGQIQREKRKTLSAKG